MLLSSTMYADASHCLKRYDYRWNQKLIVRPKDVGVALRRGIWIHKCLEEYHKGGNWLGALMDMHEWAMEHGVEGEKILEIHREVEDIMQGYIDYYSNQKPWKVLGAEYPVVLKTGEDAGLRATIDLAVEWEGNDWLVEHKSTGEFPPSSWRAVDPQTALQYWLCHQVKPVIGGREFLPVGIIFNYLLTKPPSVPRWKKDGTLYANAAITTSSAFARGASQHAEQVLAGKAKSIENHEDARVALINDSLFYRRFPVLRPEGNVRTTMQDIIATLRDLRAAEDAGWYRRSLHVTSCRRFCSYAELCAHEFSIGEESPTLREELFMPDNGERGEGR